MSRRAATLLLGWALLGPLASCDERTPSADSAAVGDREDVDRADDRQDVAADGRQDVMTGDRQDAPSADGVVDGADDVTTVVFRDRPPPMDGPVEGVDATIPDEGAVAFDVNDGCTVPRFDGPYDAGEFCTRGRSRPCDCASGRRGASICEETEHWGYCFCASVDAGITVQDGQVLVPERPIPWIGRPRLLAPQSGMRVTSQRPTLRWMLPSGIERARVELCADRPCARMLAQQELRGDRWRPSTALAAGVVFWRVRGLDEAGAVRWTSATWEFGVRHRDLGVDTSYGALKDFNGDGYDDVVTVRTTHTVLVYPGSARGVDPGRVFTVRGVADDGSSVESGLYSTTGVGDFNGDGLADLALGLHLDLRPGTNRVWVYLGSRTCGLARTGLRHRALFSAGREGVFGVMSAGDFNGDGYADFLTISDRMQLFPGGPSGPSETPMDISELVSNSAGFVGDINGDGYQDILSMPVAPPVVETPNLPMLVLYGNPEGRLDFHVERIADPRDGTETLNRSYVGYRHRWGDLNEDGYMDAVVSVPNGVYLYYGSAAGYTRIVQPRTTEVGLFGGIRGTFGGYTAHPADVDGDGHAEVMIGSVLAPADEETRRNGTGRVYVYTRDPRTGLSNTAAALTFGPPPGSFGFGSVGAPGDLNADGYDDVVVGASPNPARSDATEFLYVYHGGHAAWWRAPVARIEHPYAFERSE